MKVFSRHWVSGQEPWWAPVHGLYVAPGAPGSGDPEPAPGGGAPTPEPKEEPPANPELGPDGKPWDPKRAGETIANLRQIEKQQKETEKLLKEANAKLAAIETEKLSDLEKAQKRAEALEAEKQALEVKAREAALAAAVSQSAAKLDFADPDDASAYIALHRSEVEFDAEDRPLNVDKLLKAAIEKKPHLKKTTRTSVPGSPAGGISNSQAEVIKANEAAVRRTANYAPY